MQLYALDPGCPLSAALAAELGVAVSPHEHRRFEDGEEKLRPLADPRGQHVCVVLALHGGPPAAGRAVPANPHGAPREVARDAPHDSPHDRLVRLLMFLATLRDHGAARVTAVVPYLAYARKDRRTKPFDPLGLRVVAQLFEAVGPDELIVLEAHALAAFENAFRCPTLHVSGHAAFDTAWDAVLAPRLGERPLAVASPDPGGVKRAQLWREALEQRLGRPVGFAMVDKRRSAGVVSSERLVAGDVAGASVLLLDDLVATGGTLRHAARALRHAGAHEVLALAAHGLFVGDAAEQLADPALAAVLVTDSVPPGRLPAGSAAAGKLQVVSAAAPLAAAIRACAARPPA